MPIIYFPLNQRVFCLGVIQLSIVKCDRPGESSPKMFVVETRDWPEKMSLKLSQSSCLSFERYNFGL